jgi:hypothetical protein
MDLADDPGLRASVAAARAWGVSPSRFYGRPSMSVTVHECDARGRLVRSTTTSDPDWTDEDRDLALALVAWEADLCPGCRTPLAETTARKNETAYVTDVLLCHRCAAIGREQAKWTNHPSPHAIVTGAHLRPPKGDEDGGSPAGDG